MTEVHELPAAPTQAVPGSVPQAAVAPPRIENYFVFSETKRWYFPDGIQWIDYKVMAEGDKARFQKRTNSDVKLDRQSGEASFKVDQAAQRHELIKASVVDWYMLIPNPNNGGEFEPVPYSESGQTHWSKFNLEKWISVANPRLIEDLEFEIRKANPWLNEDMSVEEIDKEISRLNDLRQQAQERERGN